MIVCARLLYRYWLCGGDDYMLTYHLFRSYDHHAALRALNNALRQDAENLEVEVDILTEEIDDLQPEAARYV